MNSLNNTLCSGVDETYEYKEEQEIIEGADESYQILHPSGMPTQEKWAFVKLKNKSLTGADIIWQVGFDPAIESLIMWSGQTGGAITPHYRKVIPKSNRNIQEQALQEARNRYLKMTRKSYKGPGSDVRGFKFMRAEDYNKGGKIPKINYPASSESKLDGVRIAILESNGRICGLSRGNVEFITMTHLFYEASLLLRYIPGVILDCEMWHPDFSLQELGSISRTVNDIHPYLAMLELHIFDYYVPHNPPYEERRVNLERAIATYRYDTFGYTNQNEPQIGGRHLALADTRTKEEIELLGLTTKEKYESNAIPPGKTKLFLTERYIVNSHDDVIRTHRYFTSKNYEGSMIKRHANGAAPGTQAYKMSQYLNGKGRRILKYKDWYTAEGICIEVLDCAGTESGCARLKIRNASGVVLRVRPSGKFDIRKEWLNNPKLVLGKAITYKYQDLTDEGNPRHPVGIAVRDYEPGFDVMKEQD